MRRGADKAVGYENKALGKIAAPPVAEEREYCYTSHAIVIKAATKAEADRRLKEILNGK